MYQLLRLSIRKPAPQRRIDDAEDCRARTVAERQRQHSNQGEAGILHQHPRAVAHVLPKLFDPSHTTSVATLLFRLFHSAESLASGASRLFRTHPKPYVLLGLLFEVVAQFLVHLSLGLRPAQQRSKRHFKSAQHIGLLLLAPM